jgi:hypothetical protein
MLMCFLLVDGSSYPLEIQPRGSFMVSKCSATRNTPLAVLFVFYFGDKVLLTLMELTLIMPLPSPPEYLGLQMCTTTLVRKIASLKEKNPAQ